MAPLLGVAAALVGLADMAPYVRDTVRRSTRPHRGTWLIWTVLAVVVSLSQHADGGSWSVAMAVAQAVTNGLVLVLAIRWGTGRVSALDVILIAVAGGGVAGWLLAGDPLVATACVVAADLIAAAMMVPKTWRDPASETQSTFAWASLAGALSAGAVGSLEPSLLLYPVYYCLANGALALLIGARRAALGVGHGLGWILDDRVFIPLMNTAAMQRRIWEGVSQLKVSYRDGPLGRRARFSGKRVLRSDRVPDFECSRADGGRTRLHAELGSKWVLVTPDAVARDEYAMVVRERLGDGRAIALVADRGEVMLVRPDAHLGLERTRGSQRSRPLAECGHPPRPGATGAVSVSRDAGWTASGPPVQATR